MNRCCAKKVGILGFGIVGKSYLKFFSNFNIDIEINVWDKRKLNDSELDLVKKNNAKVFDVKKNSIQEFCNQQDYVAVSPGFNISDIECSKDKFICELDLFSEYFKHACLQHKSIAITGTLGKTTITNLLNQILNKVFDKPSCIGGNIGFPMLDLIEKQKNIDIVDIVDTAVLELSSFQLDQSKKFAPDIAIWTNFYPNHLDWHKDSKEYFDAKSKIFEYQNKNQHLIVPASFLKEDLFLEKLKNIKSRVHFISEENESDLSFVPDITFKQNWRFIFTALDILGLDLEKLKNYFKKNNSFSLKNNLQDHRLEHFATVNKVDFYNDSKATVIQATLSATQKINQKNKPIILILGGTSKGVGRNSLLKDLERCENLKKIFCLSKNKNEFSGIKTYSSLQELLSAIMQIVRPGDQVLFSPSGASFDLFKDYKHRGDIFKKLVLELAN